MFTEGMLTAAVPIISLPPAKSEGSLSDKRLRDTYDNLVGLGSAGILNGALTQEQLVEGLRFVGLEPPSGDELAGYLRVVALAQEDRAPSFENFRADVYFVCSCVQSAPAKVSTPTHGERKQRSGAAVGRHAPSRSGRQRVATCVSESSSSSSSDSDGIDAVRPRAVVSDTNAPSGSPEALRLALVANGARCVASSVANHMRSSVSSAPLVLRPMAANNGHDVHELQPRAMPIGNASGSDSSPAVQQSEPAAPDTWTSLPPLQIQGQSKAAPQVSPLLSPLERSQEQPQDWSQDLREILEAIHRGLCQLRIKVPSLGPHLSIIDDLHELMQKACHCTKACQQQEVFLDKFVNKCRSLVAEPDATIGRMARDPLAEVTSFLQTLDDDSILVGGSPTARSRAISACAGNLPHFQDVFGFTQVPKESSRAALSRCQVLKSSQTQQQDAVLGSLGSPEFPGSPLSPARPRRPSAASTAGPMSPAFGCSGGVGVLTCQKHDDSSQTAELVKAHQTYDESQRLDLVREQTREQLLEELAAAHLSTRFRGRLKARRYAKPHPGDEPANAQDACDGNKLSLAGTRDTPSLVIEVATPARAPLIRVLAPEGRPEADP